MSVGSRILRAQTGRLALFTAVAALLAGCSSSAGTGPGAASTSTAAPVVQRSDKFPSGQPGREQHLHLLALNPAARGQNLNMGVAGTGVNELVGQADQALAANPPPELFLIQGVDNDIRCDGTDPDNYARRPGSCS